MEEENLEQKPGCGMPIAWALIAAVLVCGGAGVTGLLGMDSESAGVTAATFSAGPVGFGLFGALAALVTHFAIKSGGARVGVPIGCGCLGALGTIGATVFFFAAIFPSL